jgi:hypothetical protein
MNRRSFLAVLLLAISVACNVGLRRPEMVQGRTLDPQMISAEPVPNVSDVVTVRLLNTQARSHIRHRILHRKADGELIEDTIWSWSSPPHRYLDTALGSKGRHRRHERCTYIGGDAHCLSPRVCAASRSRGASHQRSRPEAPKPCGLSRRAGR